MSEDMPLETHIAMQDNALGSEFMRVGALSPYTCPECHGVLWHLKAGHCITCPPLNMRKLHIAGPRENWDEHTREPLCHRPRRASHVCPPFERLRWHNFSTSR